MLSPAWLQEKAATCSYLVAIEAQQVNRYIMFGTVSCGTFLLATSWRGVATHAVYIVRCSAMLLAVHILFRTVDLARNFSQSGTSVSFVELDDMLRNVFSPFYKICYAEITQLTPNREVPKYILCQAFGRLLAAAERTDEPLLARRRKIGLPGSTADRNRLGNRAVDLVPAVFL